ncbi:MAG: DUF417 family protein [Gemmatimonadales bacterium]|nr:DUF417 family protein [Gemmatimonadales bacterium]
MAHAVTPDQGASLERIGAAILRYGLALVLIVVGLLKFTTYEAKGIEPMVSNSPLLAWALATFGLATLSAILGTIEIALGLSIASRPFAPKLSFLGSAGAIGLFLVTLTFLLTTPGIWQPGYGFPYPSPMPGQFLAKDLVLLGAAVWTAGEARRAARMA